MAWAPERVKEPALVCRKLRGRVQGSGSQELFPPSPAEQLQNLENEHQRRKGPVWEAEGMDVSRAGGSLERKELRLGHQKLDSQPWGRNPEEMEGAPAAEETETGRLLPILSATVQTGED